MKHYIYLKLGGLVRNFKSFTNSFINIGDETFILQCYKNNCNITLYFKDTEMCTQHKFLTIPP